MGDQKPSDRAGAIAGEIIGSISSLVLAFCVHELHVLSGMCLAFGCAGATQAEVSMFWIGSALLIVTVVGTLAAAWFRRAKGVWLWHVTVAIIAVYTIVDA